MKIVLTIKNVYGNDLIYPICEKAKLFVSLIGKKTFATNDLSVIERLGYKIIYQ
jgi:hypothetical protein